MNSKQYTLYEGCKSADDLVLVDVPQSSVFGPLLFLIYIIVITNIDISKMITLYANHTLLLYFGFLEDNFKNA